MFEICLKRGWAVPAKAALNLCKMVEKRMSVPFIFVTWHIAFTFLLPRWASMTPLRQFKGVPPDVIRKSEGKQFVSDDLVCWNINSFRRPQQPWPRYFDLVCFVLVLFCFAG